MEVVEKSYRGTPVGHKKYPKKLGDYVDFLVSRGRIIEAKYFFGLLCEVKPYHARKLRLGYALSIALFDNEGVKKYDKLLYESKPKDTELVWFRLRYYHSMNDVKNCEDSCEYLLSKSIKDEYLSTIIEVCIARGSYEISVNIIKYLERKKLRLSDSGNNYIRKIIVKRLLITKQCTRQARDCGVGRYRKAADDLQN